MIQENMKICVNFARTLAEDITINSWWGLVGVKIQDVGLLYEQRGSSIMKVRLEATSRKSVKLPDLPRF